MKKAAIAALAVFMASCATQFKVEEDGDGGTDVLDDMALDRDQVDSVDGQPPDGVDGAEDAPEAADDMADDAMDDGAGDAPEDGPEPECEEDKDCGDICEGWTCNDDAMCEKDATRENGAPCGESPRKICLDGSCRVSTCDDGYVDPGNGEQCEGSAAQACELDCGADGEQECDECKWGDCMPPEEQCNGRDDDCDTVCDEGPGRECCRGDTQACTTDHGVAGTLHCNVGCRWDEHCCGDTDPCNGYDDDCDDMCDEGYECCQGTTATCAMGECPGLFTCSDSCDEWSECEMSGAAPANDTCSSSATIARSGTYLGTTCGAHHDTLPTLCGSANEVADVIYLLNLDVDSRVIIDTFGTTWDTILYISTECPTTEASVVACNDDYMFTFRSRLDVTLMAGTYYLVVDGFQVESVGPFVLNVDISSSPPAAAPGNDQCSGAIDMMETGRMYFSGSTAAASNSSTMCGAAGRDVWYTFTLTQTEVVYLDLLDNQSWNAVIALRSGGCSGSGTCHDNACSTQRPQVATTLDAGTYYVVVDGMAGEHRGPYLLRFQHTPCLEGEPINVPGSVTGDTSGTEDNNDPSTACADGGGPDDVFYFTLCPGENGNWAFDVCDTRLWNSVLYVHTMHNEFNDPGVNYCGSYEAGCNDDSCGTAGNRSSFTTSLGAPALYFVIVDGTGTLTNGQYELTISGP
ncbi:MAG: hypothetical protein ABIJ56_18310 [Pseudomonadota bacterium]